MRAATASAIRPSTARRTPESPSTLATSMPAKEITVDRRPMKSWTSSPSSAAASGTSVRTASPLACPAACERTMPRMIETVVLVSLEF
jgi:hypothetical protein